MENAFQINDGLRETASCGNAAVYDSRRGLIFAEHMTGEQCMYGEASGVVNLSIFPPSQPWNVRQVQIDKVPGASRGFLCTAIYLVGDAKVRVMYTKDRGEEIGVYYKDYDFLADTLSERHTVYLHTGEGDLNADNAGYARYLKSQGFDCPSDRQLIINKVTEYNGELYTAVTLDGPGYPVLCRIKENLLCPFAILPEAGRYEFRYYRDENGIYGLNRSIIDDTGIGKIAYFVSKDEGKTWKKTLFEDGIQSRPEIIPYYGKPLILYNYRSENSQENMPPMHHHRTAVKFIYDGKVIIDVFSKYGIVEPELVNICGDLYMLYSSMSQALMYQNDACWVEDGIHVENAKEKSSWLKIGYIL